MSNYTEADLIPFALQILNENPGGVDTSKLIENLRQKMQPSEHDLEILSNRNDDKFSQKVRNLKSHKTLENKNLAVFKDDKFFITEEGKKYLIKDDNQAEDINILENWKLTTKTFNALKDQGIIYLSDLKEWPEKKLLTIPGFGKRGVEEIKDQLSRNNLNLDENFQQIDNEKEKIELDLLGINILESWPLSARTFNALKNGNIFLLGDLISLDQTYLLKLRNFGKKSLNEINDLFKKFNIDKDYLYANFNLDNWLNFKETLNTNKGNLNSRLENINVKSLLKNYNEFKEEYFKKKFTINFEFTNKEVEDLIVNDLEQILSKLNDKMVVLFKGRYGFDSKNKTLEEIGNELNVTRERVRQIELKLNSALSKLSLIENSSLIKFLKKYDFVRFHKIFPRLNKRFSSSAGGVKDTEQNKLTNFIENYCGVNQNYFKTPERELWSFDESKLTEIFKIMIPELNLEDFKGIIKDNYGYKDFLTKSAIEFMEKNKLIFVKDNKVFALKMTKNIEVAHILNAYPKGLHWKKIAEIGNRSFTNNKWDLERDMGDSSLNMTSNNDIYLIDRGTYKLLRFCPELSRKEKIINIFVEYLKKTKKDEAAMEIAFNEITLNNEFKNLNFYDARAIIKNFGRDFGLYHKGISGTNTLSFNKNIKTISLKDKIREIIDNSISEINLKDIRKKLQKTNEDLPLEAHLNDLINEFYIFRISPGTYLNYNDAINLCDKNKVFEIINKLLNSHQSLSLSFAREEINNTLDYDLSTFYYKSLCGVFAKEYNLELENNQLRRLK